MRFTSKATEYPLQYSVAFRHRWAKVVASLFPHSARVLAPGLVSQDNISGAFRDPFRVKDHT